MGANGGVGGRASSLGPWLARNAAWLVVALLATTALGLYALGRAAICPCGHVSLWNGQVASAENSQQLLDWYSLTHLVHGLLFYAGLRLVLERWPSPARLVLAAAIEAAWELAENAPIIIDRYRAVTMAWGYSGDSIVNSLADIGCMMLGFALARRLSLRAGIAAVLALELAALAAIRDNLALNILMLIAPVEAIRIWQAG